MERRLVVGELKVKRGEKIFTALKVGELPDATDVLVPIIVINGSESGPILTITSALHGDEVNGVEICYRLAQEIQPGEVSGTLVLLPICNPLAFNAKTRLTPMDNKDMNRCFPGRRNGSITDKMAYAIFEGVIKKSNYLIDFHSGSHYFRCAPHVRTFSGNLDLQEMAKSFGLKFILVRSQPRSRAMKHYLSLNALLTGAKPLIAELGEGMRLESEFVELGIAGVKGVMKCLRMIRGKPRAIPGQVILNEVIYVRTRHGGILIPRKQEGSKVIKGQKIAEMHNPYSEEIIEIRSPTSGYLLGVKRTPQTFSGERIFMICK
jgi:hypothetical protein